MRLFHGLSYFLTIRYHIQTFIRLFRSSVIPQIHCSSHCPFNHIRTLLIPIFRHTLKMTLKLIHCQMHTPRSRPLSRPQSSQAFIHVTYSAPGTRFLALLYHPPPPFTLQPFQEPLQLFPRFLNLPPYPTYLILQLFHPPTPPSSQSPPRVQQPHPLIPPPYSLRDPFYSFLNLSFPPHCSRTRYPPIP